ncbi:protease substrate recruitment factor [Scheffersomyces xylosifermentans]|uniref:protease substrate recruitment factor n=1 Tax=Scheffersomyces xylosifermentans TaxID=1304137 RepID=UPI00315CD95D
MARTRSKGLSSPRTPVSAKTKKVGAVKSNLSNASSPSVEKVKKIQIKEQKKKEAEEKETTKATVAKKSAKVSESSKDTLVPQKVAAKAISELTKFLVREQNKPKDTKSNTLFDDVEEDDDSNLYLQINTKKFVSEKPQFKPKLIKLTKSLYNQDNLKTCLIIRDQLVTTTEQIEALENENLPTITQILPLKTLKNEYKNFEKRRQLQSEYDLFIVDDALLNLMPTLLGKIFYGNGSNKIPLPIRVTSTGNPKEISVVTIKNQVEKCLQSTFFLPPMGVNISIKIGSVNSAFKEDELSQNLQDALATFEKDTLRSVNLKTTKSPSLPLYYAENLYDEETDVIENIKASEEKEETSGPKLSAFEKGLLELGAPDEVAKIIGKKLNKKNQNKKVTKKAPLKKSKVANKVEKPTKKAKA